MKSYTTAQIAKIINVHPNTVILYEKWGHIEEVKRKANGYRVFTERHLEQIKLARKLLNIDIIKIELKIKSLDIIKSISQSNLELALNKAKNYLEYIQNQIRNDSIVIRESLIRLKTTNLNNTNNNFKTNEVAKKIGVTNDVLIYWENNGLLNIARNKKNKYRVYSEKDLIMGIFIKSLRELNYTASAVLKLINKIKFNNNKTLKEIIYNLDLEYDILGEFNKLLEPMRDIELSLKEVIQDIEMII